MSQTDTATFRMATDCSVGSKISSLIMVTQSGMRDTSPPKFPAAADNPTKNGPSGSNTSWFPASSPQGISDSSAEIQQFSSVRNTSGSTGGSISSRQICVARFTYKASQLDELTIKPGDRICVLEKSSDGWWHGILLPPDGSASIDPSGQKSETIGWFPSNYVVMEQPQNRHQIPTNFNPTSPSPFSSSSQMPPTAMGAKTSAPIQSPNNLATSASSQRVSFQQSQEPTVAAQQPPTSFASYSAVPFTAPTPSSSNAFVPSLPQQYPQPVMMQTQQYNQQHQQMAPPLSGPFYPTTMASGASPMSFVDNSNGSMQVSPNERFQASPQPPQLEMVLTLYPFTKNQVEELSFNADEVLEVLEKPVDDPNWWRCRNSAGNVGLVPKNYIRVIRNTAPPISHHHASPQLASSASVQSVPMPPFQTMPMIDPRAEEVRRNFLRGSPNAFRFANQPWYWGTISRSECESLLSNLGSDGEFFVRDSETHPGDLTITMNAGSKNRNFKVHMKDGEFYIGLKVFTSLEALIENYRRHPIFKNEHEKHFLTQPFQHPECGAFLSTAVDKLLHS
nr:NCK adaptor protein [Hymenolepis microstoma]